MAETSCRLGGAMEPASSTRLSSGVASSGRCRSTTPARSGSPTAPPTSTGHPVVLATAPGERVMRPQFGCRIWDLLFEPVTANLLGLMAQAVRDALAQWEPRVEVDQ